MNTDERTADFFKALMHPVRLQILAILRDGEECVCHMEAALGLRQAYISQHLTVLREAGVVSVRRDGWNIYYQAIAPGVFGIIDAAAEIATGGKRRPWGCRPIPVREAAPARSAISNVRRKFRRSICRSA